MKPQRKDNPSSIFYWKDYENDEGLRVSSLAAQGLWMRLLCVAAKADPYGYILVNGFPLEATGAARLAGVTEGEAQSLLQELERNGVFSRDRKGRMFSRRLVRDAVVRAKAQKNGAKGGNPALGASRGKSKEKEQSVNHPDNHHLKPPYPLPHSQHKKEGGGGSAREAEKTDREAILEAIGVDPISGLTGPNGRMLGTQADMAEVDRWLDLPGMTMPLILTEIGAIMAKKRDGPPSTFRFFTKAMQRLSGELTRPALDPLTPANGAKHDRQRFDQAINAIADGLTAGKVGLGLESRDPFAARSGGNP